MKNIFLCIVVGCFSLHCNDTVANTEEKPTNPDLNKFELEIAGPLNANPDAIAKLRAKAEGGDPEAQCDLAFKYMLGIGVPKDPTETAKWMRRSAEQGHIGAQVNLANLYYIGEGVPKDFAESVKWNRLAAIQGNIAGQTNLGNRYYKGEGVPKDQVEGLAWVNIAAASGKQDAIELRDKMEKELGQNTSLLAQKRSKELLVLIEKITQTKAPNENPNTHEIRATPSAEISQKKPALNRARMSQLYATYGFLLAQQNTLELIETTFPDLRAKVGEARLAFYAGSLGDGAKGVENELSANLGDQWPEFKEKIAAQLNKTAINQNLTREEATAFLADVQSRAKGEMPEAIITTILTANPRYSKYPAFELLDRWKKSYRTKNNTKAKGVDISIAVPISWSNRESNRDDTIQVFRSNAGQGSAMLLLIIKSSPLPANYKPSNQELADFFQSEDFTMMLPDGGKLIQSQGMVLDGVPGGMLVSDVTTQQLDLKITFRMTQFIIIRDKYMIVLQFSASPLPNSAETLDGLQAQFLPVYKIIANSLVFNGEDP